MKEGESGGRARTFGTRTVFYSLSGSSFNKTELFLPVSLSAFTGLGPGFEYLSGLVT